VHNIISDKLDSKALQGLAHQCRMLSVGYKKVCDRGVGNRNKCKIEDNVFVYGSFRKLTKRLQVHALYGN